MLSKKFSRSNSNLTPNEQAAVNKTLMTYAEAPEAPGLKLHRVNNTKDTGFWSARVNRDIRLILHKDGDNSVVCYVGHHDDAYEWAERHEFRLHPNTGAMQIVEIQEVVEERLRYVEREASQPPLFAAHTDEKLLSLGVPAVYLPTVKAADSEDALLGMIDFLPEEAVDNLFALFEGRQPKPFVGPTEGSVDPYRHPDAARRFWTVSGDEDMKAALARPWAEWLIFLHPDQRSAVTDIFNGPARISGGPGTGKTVVALHRAVHLARHDTAGRVLLTTFTRTLADKLATDLNTLLEGHGDVAQRIETSNLHKVAFDIVRQGRKTLPRMANKGDIEATLTLARENHGASDWPLSFLLQEWSEIVDYWGLTTRRGYKSIRRSGRGDGLAPSERERIWPIFEEVIDRLKAEGLFTWNGLCNAARELVQDAPPYTHVVADESQDFTPSDLRLVAALAPQGPQTLTFMGDTGQRIYSYPFSWLQAGIDIRGRGRVLRVNYRTSREIKDVAERILPRKIDGPTGEPEDRTNHALICGPEPELIGCLDAEQETRRLGQWIRGVIEDGGFSPNEIAIFARSRRTLVSCAQQAPDKIGLPARWIDRDPPRSDAVALGTFHAAKGLEFRAVALIGCSSAQVPPQSLMVDAKGNSKEINALELERLLLYVGCTRARDALMISWVGEPTSFLASAEWRPR